MEQLELPGCLGRIVHLNVVARWDDKFGWDVAIRHKHRGEATMCPCVDRYEETSAGELEALLDAVVSSAHYPHSWLSWDPPTCSADVPDG